MREIVFLHTAGSDRLGHLDHEAVRACVEPLDMYELPDTDLSGYRAMIVTGGVDQELLWRERDAIRRFLDAGRVLLFSGHLVRPWLPGVGLFMPKEIRSHRDYAVRIAAPHPIFTHVREEDLTMRQGLAGFPGDGLGLRAADPEHPFLRRVPVENATWHHDGVLWPPEGALPVIVTRDGASVIYIDRVSTPGTLLVATLDPIHHFGSYFMPACERFLDGFLPWVVEELLEDAGDGRLRESGTAPRKRGAG